MLQIVLAQGPIEQLAVTACHSHPVSRLPLSVATIWPLSAPATLSQAAEAAVLQGHPPPSLEMR